MKEQASGDACLIRDIFDRYLFEWPLGEHPSTEVDQLRSTFAWTQSCALGSVHDPQTTEYVSISY